MKKQQLQDVYPILSIEIKKEDCIKKTVKDILNTLKEKIDIHPVAQFITIFDYFSHTKKIDDSIILPTMTDAQIIIFCFGKKLENPLQLAVRPRSIGVVGDDEKFVISFLVSSNSVFNDTMERWVKNLIK